MLATLLNNLKVQERQNRVCTTVAIAIVAETCSPFTVLPGLMNEYRVGRFSISFPTLNQTLKNEDHQEISFHVYVCKTIQLES